jgi:rod shape-determining protein MreB
MLDSLFTRNTYVRVKRNQFRVRNLESGADTTFQAPTPFTSVRMLVGDFTAARHALKTALHDIVKGGIIPVRSRVLIQPLELIEGGLSEIEERILREVAIGAGASKVVVWVGSELTDAEVKEKLNGK